MFAAFFLDFLTLANGTDRISQKSVTNYNSTLRKIAEEQQYHLRHSRSLKSCRFQDGCEVQYTQERWQMDMKFEIRNLNKRCYLEDLGISIKLTVEDEQIQSECVGFIWLVLNWDHKQALAIMVIKLWVSQNSGSSHQISNCQLVKAVSVCSFNHSSNVSSCVSTPV